MTSILVAAAIAGIVAGTERRSVAAAESLEAGQYQALSDKHDCKGQNACKGKGGCKTDTHACKGQNACKGQGGCKGM
ncbi:MAG TPA: hypothetical protein VMI54_08440 [Polyangiaceae bacterium]|nr:hypothetical protein [Polyangiaceae bacterium]